MPNCGVAGNGIDRLRGRGSIVTARRVERSTWVGVRPDDGTGFILHGRMQRTVSIPATPRNLEYPLLLELAAICFNGEDLIGLAEVCRRNPMVCEGVPVTEPAGDPSRSQCLECLNDWEEMTLGALSADLCGNDDLDLGKI